MTRVSGNASGALILAALLGCGGGSTVTEEPGNTAAEGAEGKVIVEEVAGPTACQPNTTFCDPERPAMVMKCTGAGNPEIAIVCPAGQLCREGFCMLNPAGSGPEGAEGSQPTGDDGGIEGVEGLEGTEGEEGGEGVEGSEGVEGGEGVEGQEGPGGGEGVEGVEGAEGSEGVEGVESIEGQEGAEGPEGAPGPCTQDTQCPPNYHCAPTSGECFPNPCNPACAKGTFCEFTDVGPACVPGCRTDTDCPPPGDPNHTKCFDVTGGGGRQCVQCTSDADCPGSLCDLGFYECTQVPACEPPCTANETCQDGACHVAGSKCGQPCTTGNDCFPDTLLCGQISKKCFCP